MYQLLCLYFDQFFVTVTSKQRHKKKICVIECIFLSLSLIYWNLHLWLPISNTQYHSKTKIKSIFCKLISNLSERSRTIAVHKECIRWRKKKDFFSSAPNWYFIPPHTKHAHANHINLPNELNIRWCVWCTGYKCWWASKHKTKCTIKNYSQTHSARASKMQNKNKTERENDETNCLHKKKKPRALSFSRSHSAHYFCANKPKKKKTAPSVNFNIHKQQLSLSWLAFVFGSIDNSTIRTIVALKRSIQWNTIWNEEMRERFVNVCLYLVYQSQTLCSYCQYTCRAELQKISVKIDWFNVEYFLKFYILLDLIIVCYMHVV